MSTSIVQYWLCIGLFNRTPPLNKHTRVNSTDYTKRLYSLTGLIFLFHIFIATNSLHSYYIQGHINKLQHSINSNKGLKLLHWNKGSSFFHNKTHHINDLLNCYSPDIVILYDKCSKISLYIQLLYHY